MVLPLGCFLPTHFFSLEFPITLLGLPRRTTNLEKKKRMQMIPPAVRGNSLRNGRTVGRSGFATRGGNIDLLQRHLGGRQASTWHRHGNWHRYLHRHRYGTALVHSTARTWYSWQGLFRPWKQASMCRRCTVLGRARYGR